MAALLNPQIGHFCRREWGRALSPRLYNNGRSGEGAYHGHQDTVAVVTGAGSGIGQAVAVELARQVRAIALVDLNPSVEETEGLIRKCCGDNDPRRAVRRRRKPLRLSPRRVRARHAKSAAWRHICVPAAGITLRRPGREDRQADRPGDDLSGGGLPRRSWKSIWSRRCTGPWKWSPASPATAMRGN